MHIERLIVCALLFLPYLSHAQIHFVENQGQWAEPFLYRADVPSGRLFVENNSLLYTFLDKKKLHHYHHSREDEHQIQGHAFRMKFTEAMEKPQIAEKNAISFPYHFYLGNNPENWKTNVSAFEYLKMQAIYPGIDFELVAEGDFLKYNFIVQPQANPQSIEWEYEGVNGVEKTSDGGLIIQTDVIEISELKPYAYQKINGVEVEVPCEFSIKDGQKVSFQLGEYNPKYTLIIDPVVIFSTYSGSLADNFGYTATYDAQGNAYSGGTVFGPDFPTTTGAFQVIWGGGQATQGGVGTPRDVGILKYNTTGTQLMYATYIGGSANEDPHSMVVDSDDNLWVMGNTASLNFPTSTDAYSRIPSGNFDIFLVKLSPNGTNLLAGTLIGGSGVDGTNGIESSAAGPLRNLSPLGANFGDMYRGEIVVDSLDRPWVASTSKSNDFPTTTNAYQSTYGGGNQDAVVFSMSSDLQSLRYSTYLGGSGDDAGFGIALGDFSNIYVCGGTESSNLNFNGYQSNYGGGSADGFIAKFKTDLTDLESATYLGTEVYDQTYFIALDDSNYVYVSGQTRSDSFPHVNAAYRDLAGKQFISKFDPTLNNLLISTTFGSGLRAAPDLSPSAFTIDRCGRIFFSGWGGSSNFGGNTNDLKTTPNAFKSSTNGNDFYIAVFAQNMEDLLYATYYGGDTTADHVDGGTSRFDPENSTVYQSICAGCGGYSDLPTTSGAWSRINRGIRPSGDPTGCNNALIKVQVDADDLRASFEAPESVCFTDTLFFESNSLGAVDHEWQIEGQVVSNSREASLAVSAPGTYEVKLVVSSPFTCKTIDSLTQNVRFYEKANAAFTVDTGTCSGLMRFEAGESLAKSWQWTFDSLGTQELDTPITSFLFPDVGSYQVRLITEPSSGCADTAVQVVEVEEVVKAAFAFSYDSCSTEVFFENQSHSAESYLWLFDTLGTDDVVNPSFFFPGNHAYLVSLIAEPESACADTTTENVQISSSSARFDYEVIDSCNFMVALYSNTPIQDSFYWHVNDTLYKGVDTLVVQLPGSGEHEVKFQTFSLVCDDSITQTINIPALPQADFTTEQEICDAKVALISHAKHSNKFRWHILDIEETFHGHGDTTFFRFDSSGSYDVLMEANPGSSCADSMLKTIEVQPLADANFSWQLDSCVNELDLRNFSTAADSLVWIFRDTTIRIFQPETFLLPNRQGAFLVRLEVYQDGCESTAEDSVAFFPFPEVAFSTTLDTCKGEVFFQNKSQNADEVFWFFGDGESSTETSPTHRFAGTGSYQVSLSINQTGFCPKSDSFLLEIPKSVNADFDLNYDQCKGEVLLVRITPNVSEWEWHLPGRIRIIKEDSVLYRIEEEGDSLTFSLAVSSDGCLDTTSASILTKPFFRPAFGLLKQDCLPSIRLIDSSRSINNHWMIEGERLDQNFATHRFSEPGKYRVYQYINEGEVCPDTLSKTIEIPEEDFMEVDIPNVFSPNDDGINDQFTIKGLNECDDYKLVIYNRWGKVVHEQSGRELSWDGHLNGKRVAEGTYYFILTANNQALENGTISVFY